MERPALRKRFGQHHLIDGSLCRPILDFLRPEGAQVLEIGPGGGVLTDELLRDAARVLAFEVDPAWAFALARGDRPGTLAVAVTDALDQPWSQLRPGTLVAGNLPYNIATALIRALLPHHDRIPRAAFLVQKEVAERMVAGPGDPAYGGLSVTVQARAKARILGRVKPGSFRPPPKVQSAFVGLELIPPPLPEPEMADLESLVRLAFAQRRKSLVNSLAAGWGKATARRRLEAAEIDPSRRAESLSLDEYLRLLAAPDRAGA